jgi:FdhD protein
MIEATPVDEPFDPASLDVAREPPAPVSRVACVSHRGADIQHRIRSVPEETPVAITYNGASYAVMMATPSDLADFALGFSLAEGVIASPADIESLEVVAQDAGVELRMWLAPARAAAVANRRRMLAGPVGCGLCGVESLAALPVARGVSAGVKIAPSEIATATRLLASAQGLNANTRAMHAAGFFVPGEGLLSAREDVGRHNALDKLIGDVARRGLEGAAGVVVVTSRVSVEMVQKAAALDAGVIVAISAPTALAIRAAGRAGVTLVAIARDDGFEVFTHPRRICAE